MLVFFPGAIGVVSPDSGESVTGLRRFRYIDRKCGSKRFLLCDFRCSVAVECTTVGMENDIKYVSRPYRIQRNIGYFNFLSGAIEFVASLIRIL